MRIVWQYFMVYRSTLVHSKYKIVVLFDLCLLERKYKAKIPKSYLSKGKVVLHNDSFSAC